MAKDKLKEAEFKAEGIRRIAVRNSLRRKLCRAKFKERARWKQAERDRYFDY